MLSLVWTDIQMGKFSLKVLEVLQTFPYESTYDFLVFLLDPAKVGFYHNMTQPGLCQVRWQLILLSKEENG